MRPILLAFAGGIMHIRGLAPSLILSVVVAVVPAPVWAQGWDRVSDVTVRINGPVHVASGDTVSTVSVVNGNAVIEGVVREQLVVVNGVARITGSVGGDAVVVNGRLDLEPGSRIGGDVVLFRVDVNRAPGAEIGGRVQRVRGPGISPIIWRIFWLAITAALILGGLVFALIAGRQLGDAALLIATRPGPTILTALIVVIGLPALAVLCFISVIGIPLGLLVLFFLIPILALLGYIVTGAWLGAVTLGAIRRTGFRRELAGRLVVATVIGIVLLQILGLLPWFGGLVVIAASQLGAGALVYRTWTGARDRRAARATAEGGPPE